MHKLTLDELDPVQQTRHAGFHRWADGPALGYLVLRLMIGMNFLMHGLTRVVAPSAFVDHVVGLFKDTILPGWSVRAFATILPWVELILGLMIFVGLCTRWALLAAGLTMVVLTFGTTLRSDWSTAGGQLLYSVVFYLLLVHLDRNVTSVDRLVRGNAS